MKTSRNIGMILTVLLFLLAIVTLYSVRGTLFPDNMGKPSKPTVSMAPSVRQTK